MALSWHTAAAKLQEHASRLQVSEEISFQLFSICSGLWIWTATMSCSAHHQSCPKPAVLPKQASTSAKDLQMSLTPEVKTHWKRERVLRVQATLQWQDTVVPEPQIHQNCKQECWNLERKMQQTPWTLFQVSKCAYLLALLLDLDSMMLADISQSLFKAHCCCSCTISNCRSTQPKCVPNHTDDSDPSQGLFESSTSAGSGLRLQVPASISSYLRDYQKQGELLQMH